MSYRNKTYICFDADTDMRYYRLMTAWKENERIEFNFHNAHDLNNLRDGSSEETIKRKLRERMNNSKVLIVLIGQNTKNLHKFVRWEQEIALEMGLPIIAVNLSGKRQRDDQLCPPIIKDELAIHVSFGMKIIKLALDNWPAKHAEHKKIGKKAAFYYEDSVYNSLA